MKHVGRALAFGLVYYFVDYSLDSFAIGSGWSILWPLNGITIALLIMRPRSEWPAILIGIEIGTAFAEHRDSPTLNAPGPESIQRLISLVEVVLSAILLPAFSTLTEWLHRPRIFLRFVGALLLGPTVSGMLAAAYFHWQKGQAYLPAFDDWAAADALGIAAVMPLALSFRSRRCAICFV